MSIFSEKVQKIMNEHNLSQKQLSEMTHISEASLSRYISGRLEPRIDVVLSIAKALGVEPTELLSDFKQNNKKDVYQETLSIVARNKSQLTDEQKTQLVKVLFGGKQ